MNRKREIERELDKLIDYKIKGAQIRSKAKYIVDGEKKYKLFSFFGEKAPSE